LAVLKDGNRLSEARLSSSPAMMHSLAAFKKVPEVNPGALLRRDFPAQFNICNMMLTQLSSKW